MTPRGNMVHQLIFMTLIFEAVCLALSIGFYLIDCFRWELGPLYPVCMSRRLVFPRVASRLRFIFSLKINNIIKSVLKGSEASLFVDDFALCRRIKSPPHAERFMQHCVSSAQDLVSHNGFKFSTSKTVRTRFCNRPKCRTFYPIG